MKPRAGSMFRTLHIETSSLKVWEDTEVASPRPGDNCWIDLSDFESEELQLLQQRFEFHPLAIEDCTLRTSEPRSMNMAITYSL
jgi:Mg2+ and Co2+ transporter CorA